MDRKLIFLDIDGTLRGFKAEVSPLVPAAVHGAQALGHGVFLCTGRNMPSIPKDLLALGFDGVIASAGSYIEVGGHVLLDEPMPEPLVQQCLELFHGSGIYCCIETKEAIYVDAEMEKLVRASDPSAANSEMQRLVEQIAVNLKMRPYGEYPRQGGYKICFTSPDLPSVGRVTQALGERFDVVIYAFVDNAVCCNGEIIRKDMDKGHAVERVCRHLGVDIADSVAFGDSMNDYGMLRRAGVGIAMGNACQELKDACDGVCEDVDHDGVYHELVRRGLCVPV